MKKMKLFLLICIILNFFSSVIFAVKPFINHIYTADPTARMFEGRVYVYASHDKDNAGEYDMEDYHVFSSADMKNWVDHGVVFSYKDLPLTVYSDGSTEYGWVEGPFGANDGKQWGDRRPCFWAPDCAYKKGKYYLYYPAQDYDVPQDKVLTGQIDKDGKPIKNWRWNAFKIGVAVSDTPYGPFVPYYYSSETQYPPDYADWIANPDTQTYIYEEPYTGKGQSFEGYGYIPGSYSIDPTVLVEDDGTAYMFFGGVSYGGINDQIKTPDGTPPQEEIPFNVGNGPRIVQLKDNMAEFEYEPKEITVPNYYEGPFIHKRYNPTDGKIYYYLSFPDTMGAHSRGSEMHYAWTTLLPDQALDSDTVIWNAGNMILPAIGSAEAGMQMTHHGSIVEYKGDWFVFYHTNEMSYKYGDLLSLRKRSICVNKLEYNYDGTIKTVAATKEELAALKGVGNSAFSRIKAQLCSLSSGVQIDQDCTGGDIGKMVSYTYNNSYIIFNNLDFGSTGANGIELQVASGNPDGGTINIYLDGIGWHFVDSIKIDTTEGWGNWKNVSFDLDETIGGVQNVKLEFISHKPDPILNLNWIRFKPSVPAPIGYSVALKSQNPNCIPNGGGAPGQKYLCNDDMNFICANRDAVGPWERFSVIAQDVPGVPLARAIQLNSSKNGQNLQQYLPGKGGEVPIIADGGNYNQPDESNSFYWESNFDGTISLKGSLSGYNRYFCVDTNFSNNPGYLYPNSREKVGEDGNALSWEKFYCEVSDAPIGSIVGFKTLNPAINDQYLCVDNEYSKDLCANRPGINGDWEKFEVVDANNGYIALKSLNNNQYISITKTPNLLAKADGGNTIIREYNKFQWQNNGDGTISLYCPIFEKYLCVDTSYGGTNPAKCYASRDSVDGPEVKFYCQVTSKQKMHFANSFITNGCLTVSSDNYSVYCQPKNLSWNTQSWIVETQIGNTVKIKNTSNGKYLTVESNNEAAFVNVEGWSDTNRQKWIVEKNYQGFIRLKNVSSGKYLTSHNRPYERTSAFAILCQTLNESWGTQKWINE